MTTASTSGVVDVHAHFVTASYIDAAVAAGHTHPDGMARWQSWSADDHLRVMDANGIERSVLSISSPGVHFGDDAQSVELAHEMNLAAADVVERHPDRFAFFASVPLPDVDAAVAEAAYAIDRLGASGVVVETNTHGRYVGDPAFAPLLTELDRRGSVLFVHPTSPPGAEDTALGYPRPMLEFLFETTRSMTDLILSGALKRHPDLNVITTHCGGFLSLVVERLELFVQGLGIAGGDASVVRESLSQLWFDLAGTPVPAQADALIRQVGSAHLLYGSDYCWTPAPLVAAQVAALDAHWSADGHGSWRDLVAANARHLWPNRVAETAGRIGP